MTKRRYKMKNEKKYTYSLRKGIKDCLSVALKSNANSAGCYFLYQPKIPKNLNKLKKIND